MDLNMVATTKRPRSLGYYTPFLILLFVLVSCAVRGYFTINGLARPADIDSFRDVGYIQALLDRNWLGDPLYGDELRFYSPLMHVIAAAAAWATGLSPMVLWLQAAPWFNLLAPLAFFDMSRRLFNLPIAAVATVIFELNGVFVPPWIAAGYSPWPIVCNLALPLFFVGVSLIFEHGRSNEIRHAVVIGAVSGFAFLTHPYPAILLTVIAVVTAFNERGLSLKTIAWLSILGIVELMFALVVLGPLFVKYNLHTLNYAYAFWVDPIFDTTIPIFDTTDWLLFLKRLSVVAYDVPGFVLAVAGVLLLLQRRLPDIDRRTQAILVAWIGVCAVLLFRHYACEFVNGEATLCRIPIVPVHHSHFYLQAAWSCLWSYVLWKLLSRLHRTIRSRGSLLRAATLIIVCIGLVGSGLFFKRALHRTYDFREREWALGNEDNFELDAYDWILRNTRPDDLFVTQEAATDKLWDDRAFAVMAAGRRLVVVPVQFSNPYVDWSERDRRRKSYLSALSESDGGFCDLVAEAGKGAKAWFLVTNETPAKAKNANAILRTKTSSLYQVQPDCKE
jgi:hypothetical protein